jgi:hypothetical protein
MVLGLQLTYPSLYFLEEQPLLKTNKYYEDILFYYHEIVAWCTLFSTNFKDRVANIFKDIPYKEQYNFKAN